MDNDRRPLAAAVCVVLAGFALFTTHLYAENPILSLFVMIGAAGIAPLLFTTVPPPFSLAMRASGIILGLMVIATISIQLNERYGYEAFAFWPLILVALAFIAVGGFIATKFLTYGGSPASTGGSMTSDSVPAFGESLINGFRYEAAAKVVAAEAQIEVNLRSIHASKSERRHVDELDRTFGPEADAINSAHGAAKKAGVHPAVYHMPEFQLGKLQAELAKVTKLFDVKLQELQKAIDVKFAKIIDKYKRKQREQTNRARPAQADNGKNLGPDIPEPERTTAG